MGRESTLNYPKIGPGADEPGRAGRHDGGKCILQLRGVRPFLSDKYDLTQHPNYKYTATPTRKTLFDMESSSTAAANGQVYEVTPDRWPFREVLN